MELREREEFLQTICGAFATGDCNNIEEQGNGVSNNIIELFSHLAKIQDFDKMDNAQKTEIFRNAVVDMAYYVGIEPPDFEVDYIDNLITFITYEDYKNFEQENGEASAILQLCSALPSVNAKSKLTNQIHYSFYTGEYYRQVQERFQLSKKGLDYVRGAFSYGVAVRHECQHLKQFAMIKDYLNNKPVASKYQIMALVTIMKETLARYSDKEETMTGYFCDPLEVDARFSEITFSKKLLESGKLSKNDCKSFGKYECISNICSNFFWLFEEENQFANLSLARMTDQYFKIVRTQFEKEFGATQLGSLILSEFDKQDLKPYFASLDRQEKMAMDFYNRFSNDKYYETKETERER